MGECSRFRSSGKVLKCSGCQYVYYCNRECQKVAWTNHKAECSCLRQAAGRIVPDAARVMLRIILKLNNGGDAEKGYYTEKFYRKFKDLMSREFRLFDFALTYHHSPSWHCRFSGYSKWSGSTWARRSTHRRSTWSARFEHDAECHRFLGHLRTRKSYFSATFNLAFPLHKLRFELQMIVNAFSILDQEMNSIATGIYLGVSVTDHSCAPNAVATFNGTTLFIRTIQDLPSIDWSKVGIARSVEGEFGYSAPFFFLM